MRKKLCRLMLKVQRASYIAELGLIYSILLYYSLYKVCKPNQTFTLHKFRSTVRQSCCRTTNSSIVVVIMRVSSHLCHGTAIAPEHTAAIFHLFPKEFCPDVVPSPHLLSCPDANDQHVKRKRYCTNYDRGGDDERTKDNEPY